MYLSKAEAMMTDGAGVQMTLMKDQPDSLAMYHGRHMQTGHLTPTGLHMRTGQSTQTDHHMLQRGQDTLTDLEHHSQTGLADTASHTAPNQLLWSIQPWQMRVCSLHPHPLGATWQARVATAIRMKIPLSQKT